MHKTVLAPGEHRKVLDAWNETRREYPREATIHELISEQARLTPDRVALTFEGESLTYAALEQRSNQLAHTLRDHGVGLETFVGLYVHRSLEMVIGILGIMKAGGAYIPIDPVLPAARIKLLLEDAQLRFLVTQEELLANLDSALDMVSVNVHSRELVDQPTNPPLSMVGPSNLAYVIYTSGSTGRPKGVLIEHRSVVNLVTTIAAEPGMSSEDNVLAATTLSFDVSVLELFLPLTVGARMTIVSRDVAMDGQLLGETMEKAGVTVVLATPATWRLLLLAGWKGKEDLRILVAGEAVPQDLVQALLPRCAELWNMYGPTEATVYSTGCQLTSADEQITIGRPIANTQTYILDKGLQPVPIGVVGDLYVGGDGVARGYYNRPQLNAERFIPNPFYPEFPSASPVIYQTGDRASYLEDGRIVFHGREDFQVKIRGFRVELGDVETAIAQHPAVAQNVTIAREDVPGDKRLVTYIIAERGQSPPTATELRTFLRLLLPEYMLPAHVVTLTEFPLTPSNKINRLALPAPVRSRADSEQPFTAPRNQLERTLAKLAADILNVSEISIDDDFFDLGGNSLLAMRLLALIQSSYHVSFPARTFFQEPTIAKLSQVVEHLRQDRDQVQGDPGQNGAGEEALYFTPDEDLVLLNKTNLTRGQFLMWMGQRMVPDVPLYNVIQAFSIRGPLQVPVFRQAFQSLVDGNDVLRTVIDEIDGIPRQRVLDSVTASVELVDLTVEPDPQAAYQAWLDERKVQVLPFDQPLFDTALIRLAAGHFIWYLGQHHIITDALSSDLIFKRVSASYQQIMENRPEELPPHPQFVDHVAFERDLRQEAELHQAIRYWQQLSRQSVPPTDFYGNSAAGSSLETLRVTLELGPERSARLREIAHSGNLAFSHSDVSLFTIFATLLFVTLHRISGQSKLRIGTPFHGRPTAKSLGIIGLFIEMGLLQIDLDSDETFASLVDKVLTETLTGLSHVEPGISSAAINQSYDVILNFLQPTFTSFAGLPVTYDWVHSGYIDRPHSLRVQVTDFEGSGEFSLAFDMKTAVFGESERSWLLDHFLQVVDAFIDGYHQPLGAFSLISSAERESLLMDFNDTDAPFPQDRTVVQLFEEQVDRTSNKIAAVDGATAITYRQLNERANRLAHFLRERQVGPGTTVAVCMERSIDALVAILGVLKAGGAYIPIDATYPGERIAFIAEDANTGLALVSGAARLSELTGAAHMNVVDLAMLDLSTYPATNPDLGANPNDLAYMIYTSGSTGRPKGVMIAHRSLVNYACWARRTYQDANVLDFPLYSSLAFDLTVTSIFVPLVSGGRVVVYGESPETPGLEILSVFSDREVDIVKLTPSHLGLVREFGLVNPRIRKLIVGGEDFKTELAREIYEMFAGQIEIYNEYGPTEATVGCMLHRYDPERDTAISVPIGNPAANARVYLLDAYDQPVPPGVLGEMVISSVGVARGYHRRPELTASRFGDDPFRPGARIYRTGDVARWNAAGQMVFLGRRDHQVKIGGARIELGEVEANLLTHGAIRDAVVSVVQFERQPGASDIIHCERCGLPSNYPRISFNAGGVCSLCTDFDTFRDDVFRYFKTKDDLDDIVTRAKAENTGEYDCMMLYSGGKDSTYVLSQLIEMGLKVLAFSLDNGYISEEAKENVRRVTSHLGVDLVFATTPHMNAIFADSLERYSNVCQGCYKTIYTLSMKLARDKGIRYIFTGLSRGQLFETRLDELFRNRIFDVAQMDAAVLAARKVYHRVDDAVKQLLDVSLFADDRIFGEIQFVDYFRYVDVELEEVYDHLASRVPWIRPTDTGRSTNCLINEAGIFVHQTEQGYHNYALPYSWDVRLGHKTREEAMEELDDDIRPALARQMLDEVGYTVKTWRAGGARSQLAAYFVSDDPSLTVAELRAYVAQRLPAHMIPSYFVRLEQLPLTPNGKVDRQALPSPTDKRPELDAAYVAPESELERQLADFWSQALNVARVGAQDNFFDLGGASIPAVQIVARISDAYNIAFPISSFFAHPTIAEQSAILEDLLVAQLEEMTEDEAAVLLAKLGD